MPARKNFNADFPLRGSILCGDCDKPLTGCWSKGRHTTYPYYLCQTRGCVSRGKSIRREKLEGEFEALLRTLTPAPMLFNVARAMFEDLWNHRLAMAEQRKVSLVDRLDEVEKQTEQLLDRIVSTDTPTLIKAYEARIRKLEDEKLTLGERIANCGRPVRTFEDTYRTALDFLSNPWILWSSSRIEDKRAVMKLAFADRLSYVRNEGYRTAEPSLPFKVLAGVSGGNFVQKLGMVDPSGIEPLTSSLRTRRSPS